MPVKRIFFPKKTTLLSRIVSSSQFALADLFLVVLSGLLWIFGSHIGILPPLLIALIPWAVRIVAGLRPFKRTPFDWLVALFFVTAWVGYWAAHDSEAAWNKIWLIALAVLLYYALSAQPKENLGWVSTLLFCVGLGISIHFFLTQDFVALPREVEIVNRIGRKIMEFIPRSGWTPIHPNYVAGIAAIGTPFILYPAWELAKRRTLRYTFVRVLTFIGTGASVFAVLMATSRGVIMAIASAVGVWMVWQIINLNGSRLRLQREAVFPLVVLLFICAVVLFLYAGPANSGGSPSDSSSYGTGSRGELFARSAYLLLDFPFTGGGLGAFPGLYSYYMLGIPTFYLPNSHNLFLDVAIEQGLLGGMSYLAILLMSIWFTARKIGTSDSHQPDVFRWLTLFALVIAFVHGMVDDYLYHESGTLLVLSLAGLAMISQPEVVYAVQPKNDPVPRFAALIMVGFLALNVNGIRSAWYANLGAVQMAKVELAGFPTNQWTEPSLLPRLEQADALFQSALQVDPANQTANHRLGLIAMLRRDFHSAATYLEEAHKASPNHRGIIKSLGYCYAWLGEMEKAQIQLRKIPEARSELKVYIWWWEAHGNPELAEKASLISSELNR